MMSPPTFKFTLEHEEPKFKSSWEILVEKAQQRLDDDFDVKWLIHGNGQTGISKSTLGMQLAKAIDPNFTYSKAHYDPVEVIRDLKSGKDLYSGRAHVMDEMVGIEGDQSRTRIVRAIQYICETHRALNQFFVFITPYDEYVPDDIKVLLDGTFDVQYRGRALFSEKRPGTTEFVPSMVIDYPEIPKDDPEYMAYKKRKNESIAILDDNIIAWLEDPRMTLNLQSLYQERAKQ